MDYLKILRDKEIKAIYSQIDMANEDDPKYYGLQHTLNTIDYAKQLAKAFDLDEREENLLLISASLHNIGYLNGKNLHPQTGAEMARTYLRKKNCDPKDISIVCNAIRSHVGKRNDDFYNSVSACMILADKMDFGASRYKERAVLTDAEDIICSKITFVEVQKVPGGIQLLVGGGNVDWNRFVFTSAYSKIYKCFEAVCKKSHLTFSFKRKR